MSSSENDAPSTVYYKGQYWNDLVEVRSHLNRLATGNPDLDWVTKVIELHEPGHALILNCGNGWVERELFDRGLILSAVALDVSDSLLHEAENSKGSRPIHYVKTDINSFEFPQNEFDFVINHAAIHHTAKIDRTMRGVANTLKQDGFFVNWDYVGPHRNQYPYEQWETVFQINSELPESLQADLVYPHLPTMLATDPSEAIHSELFMATFDRYFDSVHSAALGGGLAYPLLTHNPKFHAASDEERLQWLNLILERDIEYTQNQISRSLFAFVIGRPKILRAIDSELLELWTRDEEIRESNSSGKIYYPPSLLAILTQQLA
jgi:SAM-dependent methyltransferase